MKNNVFLLINRSLVTDLGTAGENVKRVKLYTFLRRHATGSATTELHIVHVERGMSWDEAMERWAELVGPHEGFYLSHQVCDYCFTKLHD